MSDKPADPAQAQQQFGAALKARQVEFAQTFTQIVSLMMRDQKFKGLRMADLEWLVLPPILAGQWQVAQGMAPAPEGTAGGKLQGNVAFPVATALWARVSPEVDARLSAGVDKPLVLKPEEWTSGTILWMIAIIGDPMYLKNFLTQMQSNVFKGQTVKIRGATPDGKPSLRTLDDLLKQTPAAQS
jgi:cytolysin-activating lysine-acyltransferase